MEELQSTDPPCMSKSLPSIFKLPREIRNLIYLHACSDSWYELYHADNHESNPAPPKEVFRGSADDYRIQEIPASYVKSKNTYFKDGHVDRRSRGRYYVRHNGRVALLYVCRQTRREIFPAFVGVSTFHVTCVHSADRLAMLLPEGWSRYVKEIAGEFRRLDVIQPSVFPQLRRVEFASLGTVPRAAYDHYTLEEFTNMSAQDLMDAVLEDPGSVRLASSESSARLKLPAIRCLSTQIDFIINAWCQVGDHPRPLEDPYEGADLVRPGPSEPYWAVYAMRFSTRERILDLRLSRIVALSLAGTHNLDVTESMLEKWDPRKTWPGSGIGTGSLGRRLEADLQSQRNPVNRLLVPYEEDAWIMF